MFFFKCSNTNPTSKLWYYQPKLFKWISVEFRSSIEFGSSTEVSYEYECRLRFSISRWTYGDRLCSKCYGAMRDSDIYGYI